MKRLILVALALFISGCAPSQEYTYKTADEVYMMTASTQVHQKEWIRSPRFEVLHFRQKPYRRGFSYVYLLTFVVDGRIQFHGIEVSHLSPKTPILFNKAYDINGDELTFVPLSSDTSQAWYGEDSVSFTLDRFVVLLGDEHLISATKSGIYIKCVGKFGDRIITLEPHYVEGYLKKCRELTVEKTPYKNLATGRSCEQECKKMFEQGALIPGMTVEACIKVLCK